MREGEDKKIISLPLPEIWGKNETPGSDVWRRQQAKRARRHSRFVFFLRIVLPSIAALLIGLLILWPQLQAQKEGFSLADMNLEQFSFPDDQVMENPRLFVVDDDNRPVNVTAKTAKEAGDAEGRKVLLNTVEADMMLKQDVWVALDAQKALYSQDENRIELQEKVNIYSDKGYELETTQAFVNVNNKEIIGNQKTKGQGPSGYVESDGFAVYEGGNRLAFTGNVRLFFYPEKEN